MARRKLLDRRESDYLEAGVGAMGAALALGFSGRYGESATEECRKVKEWQVSCTSGVEEACRSLQERKPK